MITLNTLTSPAARTHVAVHMRRRPLPHRHTQAPTQLLPKYICFSITNLVATLENVSIPYIRMKHVRGHDSRLDSFVVTLGAPVPRLRWSNAQAVRLPPAPL